jgi:hypothetical protein
MGNQTSRIKRAEAVRRNEVVFITSSLEYLALICILPAFRPDFIFPAELDRKIYFKGRRKRKGIKVSSSK